MKPKAGFNNNPQNINRNGRPKKGYSITEWFKSMLKSKPEVRDAIGKKIIEKALKGDITAMKLVWSYMDGLPQQSIDMTSNGKPIPLLGGASVQSNKGNKKNTKTK